MKSRRIQMMGVALTAGLAGCMGAFSLFGPPLTTVASVDLQKYAGRWYEIARYPNFFEVDCEGVTATYTPQEDGSIGVLNVCRDTAGQEVRRIEGTATVPDSADTAKLTVQFPSAPFPAPYWVIDLDSNYQYAVVGDPTRTFLWILSRTPTLEDATYQGILERVQALGYSPDRLTKVSQPAGQ